MLKEGAFFQRKWVWGSAPYPGIYRFAPIPRRENVTIIENGMPGHSTPRLVSVLGPGSALGSFPSVALSSARSRVG